MTTCASSNCQPYAGELIIFYKDERHFTQKMHVEGSRDAAETLALEFPMKTRFWIHLSTVGFCLVVFSVVCACASVYCLIFIHSVTDIYSVWR